MGVRTMAERYRRPDWVRRLNLMGDASGGPRAVVPLDADDLLDLACGAVGGTPADGDLGDSEWLERFRSLVDGADRSSMHVVGRLMTRQELLRALRTRLLVGRHHLDHPHLAGEHITAPWIIVGAARSGTTILFELLALDPGLRAPVAWEGLHPAALPDTDGDHRRAAAECEQELWADVQPEFAGIHELRADLAVECVTMMAPGFTTGHWGMVVADLVTWWPDIRPSYGFHTKLLQVLQGGTPTTWLLKSPLHLMNLPHALAAYPDAWFIQPHRDPVKTLPSTVSTAAMVHWLRADAVDLAGRAVAVEAGIGALQLHTMEARARGDLPDRQFVDLRYADLLDDPVGAIASVYEQSGRQFSEVHAKRITDYLRDKPQGKHGAHAYSCEELGLDETAIRTRMRPYIDRYRVDVGR